ncbi:MAG: hypothetical protein KF866_11690 [Phycisphaeraceae bacterium]|nr:hypothetical protein [Phycisphaeraceae bacterium]MCW5755196.1 hypothetical protein [Phycisphaeraceae bacterium]
MTLSRISIVLASVLMLWSLTGCGCSPGARKFNVQVTGREDLLASGHVEIDIIAINESDRSRWEQLSMDSYASSIQRQDARDRLRTLSLSKDAPTQTLSMNDEIWNRWMRDGSMHLFVLAPTLRVPGASGAGAADARREILPLDRCRWKSGKIEIEVGRSGIRTLTPPEPPKSK